MRAKTAPIFVAPQYICFVTYGFERFDVRLVSEGGTFLGQKIIRARGFSGTGSQSWALRERCDRPCRGNLCGPEGAIDPYASPGVGGAFGKPPAAGRVRVDRSA